MHPLRLYLLFPALLLVAAVTIGCGGTVAPKTPPTTTSGGTPSPTTPGPTTPTPGPGPTTPPAPSASAEYVYTNVGTSTDYPGSIYGFSVDPATGKLSPVSGSPFTVSENSSSCTVGCYQQLLGDPQGKYLFSDFNGHTTGMITFQVDPASGAINQTDFRPPSGTYISTDPQGNALLGLGFTNNTAAAESFVINRSTNTLSPAPGMPYPFEAAAQTSYGAPAAGSNGFVYALSYCSPDCGNNGNSQWNGWKLDPATGMLTPLPGFPQDAGGRLMAGQAITPSGKFLYAQELYFKNNTGYYEIVGYSVNADGTLTRLPWTVPTNNTGVPPLLMSPNGNFLLNTVGTTLQSYAIDQSTGALTASGSVSVGGNGISGVVVDPAVKYVYVGGVQSASTSPAIVGYTVNPATGALTPIAGGTTTLPGAPGSLAVVKP